MTIPSKDTKSPEEKPKRTRRTAAVKPEAEVVEKPKRARRTAAAKPAAEKKSKNRRTKKNVTFIPTRVNQVEITEIVYNYKEEMEKNPNPKGDNEFDFVAATNYMQKQWSRYNVSNTNAILETLKVSKLTAKKMKSFAEIYADDIDWNIFTCVMYEYSLGVDNWVSDTIYFKENKIKFAVKEFVEVWKQIGDFMEEYIHTIDITKMPELKNNEHYKEVMIVFRYKKATQDEFNQSKVSSRKTKPVDYREK